MLIGPISYRGRYGYICEDGEFAVRPEFQMLGEAREERISFVEDGRLGFLDFAGNVVVAPTFEPENYWMPHFSEGMASVRSGGLVGYVDRLGRWLIPPRFNFGYDMRHGKALVVSLDAGYLLVDVKGERVTSFDVHHMPALHDWPLSWNFFKVFVGEGEEIFTQWLDCRATIVFPKRYRWMTNWHDEVSGFCEYQDRVYQPWGLVRLDHVEILRPTVFELGDFSEEGLARAGVTSRRFGFINHKGEWAIEPQFDRAVDFHDGLACVTVKGRQGFINSRGHMVIEPRFRRETSFVKGFAMVHYDDKQGVIDKMGNVIWEQAVSSAF